MYVVYHRFNSTNRNCKSIQLRHLTAPTRTEPSKIWMDMQCVTVLHPFGACATSLQLTSHPAWRSRWLSDYFFSHINFKRRYRERVYFAVVRGDLRTFLGVFQKCGGPPPLNAARASRSDGLPPRRLDAAVTFTTRRICVYLFFSTADFVRYRPEGCFSTPRMFWIGSAVPVLLKSELITRAK